jgi:hypothetical protein
MSYKVPGILSLALALIALVIADQQLLSASLILGLAYAFSVPLLFVVVLYGYCRKCPHATSHSCRHVILGLLVTKLFKTIEPAKYTKIETLIATLPLLFLFLFPQYWLFGNLVLFIIFWVLTVSSVLSIGLAVCPNCKNTFCFFCPNKAEFS